MNEPLAVSIVEAAHRAGISRSSIYAAITRGELKIKKAGRRSLILVVDLKGWVSALPDARQVTMRRENYSAASSLRRKRGDS